MLGRSSAARLIPAIATWLALATASDAQQTPPAGQPTFRSGVDLVTIDVTVLDRDGRPVADLTAKDFDVKLNGQVRPVRALDTRPESQLFLIVIDDLSFPFGSGKGLFEAAARFVAGLPGDDVVGFATSSGMGIVNPTTDRRAIRSAIAGARGQGESPRSQNQDHTVGISEALAIARGDDNALSMAISRECRVPLDVILARGPMVFLSSTGDHCPSDVLAQARRIGALTARTRAAQINALTSVLTALRAVPGLKHIVLLSNGVPVTENVSDFNGVARAAAQASAQVSVLREESSDIDLADASSNATGVRGEDSRIFRDGAQFIADLTGGLFYRVVGAPDPSFARVAEASAERYRLGVEAPDGLKRGADISAAVAVRRPGVTVHANRRAMAPGAPEVLPVEAQLRDAVSSGAALYAVPIDFATALRASAESSATISLGISVRVPGTIGAPLTTMFGVVDDAGRVSSGRKVVERPVGGGDYRWSIAVPVAPGRYHVRVAVADVNGSVGSVESVVVARLPKIGPFTASDLMTSCAGADGVMRSLVIEELPASAVLLNTSIDLYVAPGAAPPASTGLQFDLIASGQQAPLLSRRVAPDAVAGVLRAGAQFSVDALPPGIYTVRATVFAAGSAPGSISAMIRKR